MANKNRDSLNRANPQVVADILRKIGVGDLLSGQVIQHRRKLNMDTLGASSYNLSTLDALVLPPEMRASSVVRATVRAGGVTGELTPVAYGATPTTGQIAVGPNGNILTLGTDAITDMDVTYIPERGEVFEAVFPVAAGVLTIPTSYATKGVVLLLEAEGLEGSVTGKKIVLVPGAAPATLQARLNVAKTQVLFNSATDGITRARVKLLLATSKDLTTFLETEESYV